MPLLARPIVSSAERWRLWERVRDRSGFDPVHEAVAAKETRVAPELAVRLRLSVLLRTYRGDYHTDAFEVPRLARRVAGGEERIIFWGAAADVRCVREWIRTGAEPRDDELEQLSLGTATMLCSDEFGTGYVEMCRTGSVSRTVPSNGAILGDVIATLAEGKSALGCPCHTFASVPRNRKSTDQIPGGAAIQRFHVRELGSSYWGVAPWYVMQGGYLEVLDYRELYPDPEAVQGSIMECRGLYFASDHEASYAANLLALNLRHSSPKVFACAAPSACDAGAWGVRGVCAEHLRPFNPIVIFAAREGAHPSLTSALDVVAAATYASSTIYLPVEEQGTIAAQAWLLAHGYRLAMLVPSKPDVLARGGRCPFYGAWTRPRPQVSLAPPFYLKLTSDGPEENRILEYLASLVNAWTEATTFALGVQTP